MPLTPDQTGSSARDSGLSDRVVRSRKRATEWRKIGSAPCDGSHVDLWLRISASPMSFGMGDSFRVPDAWFENGKWVHRYNGKTTELVTHYVTHWLMVRAPHRADESRHGGCETWSTT